MGLVKKLFIFFVGFLLVVQTQEGLTQSAPDRIRPYLTFNQPKYVSGDTVWLKIYVLNKNLVNASGKHRIHINLVDNQGNSKLHFLALTVDGVGQNQLPLPESIEPGLYLLTAYLDGQSGDGQFFLFKREIPVVSKEFQLASRTDNLPDCFDSVHVNLELSQTGFYPRYKVPVKISLKDNRGTSVEGEFSVSVLKKDLFSDRQPNSFCQELRTLFSESENEAQASIKAANNQQRLVQVLFPDSEQPMPDSTRIYFYLQKSRWRYQTIVGKNGWIKLSLPDLHFQDEFFFLAEINGQVTENIKVKWEMQNVVLPEAPTPKRKDGADNYAIYASKKKLIDQSFGFYSLVKTKIPVISEVKSQNDILPISITVNTQDYDLFPTMQEYIKEIVPALYYRNRGGKDIVRVKLQSPGVSQPPASAGNDPIYIVDGVATRNTSFFLSLKPADIFSIKIANDPRKLAPWGLFGKNGVVIVQTRRGNLREPLNDPSKIFDGLSGVIPFKMKSYDGDEQALRIPDFRSNLYWNPAVVTDENGKATVDFFCSDDIGEFEIKIQGITKRGQPFSFEQSIWVKP